MSHETLFEINNASDFSFNLYEHIPLGTHIATIKDIAVEKNKLTQSGMVDYYTIVFYLEDECKEFNYSFKKSNHPKSKCMCFFQMLSNELHIYKFDGDSLIDRKLEITISVEQFEGKPGGYIKIINIKNIESEDSINE